MADPDFELNEGPADLKNIFIFYFFWTTRALSLFYKQDAGVTPLGPSPRSATARQVYTCDNIKIIQILLVQTL